MGGTMVFEKTPFDTIEVKVLTDTGSELTGASEGFQRMKKIAVVMAIISSRLGGGRFMYPFIADAPFSAFGKNFINNFFETVPDVFDQSIILIKDLYDIDDPECLSEDGHKILDSMRSGELKGTFYVNRIPEEADPTNLKTTIVRYK
jgi:DNA sulfur modification protein DndD